MLEDESAEKGEETVRARKRCSRVWREDVRAG
jgi:hypothetical protein